jgi:hypothetical protein
MFDDMDVSLISSNEENKENDGNVYDSFLWFTKPITQYNNNNLVIALLGEEEQKLEFIKYTLDEYKLSDNNYITNMSNAHRLIGLNIDSNLHDIRIISIPYDLLNAEEISHDDTLANLCNKGIIDFIICILNINIFDTTICNCFYGKKDELSKLKKSLKLISNLANVNVKLIAICDNKLSTQEKILTKLTKGDNPLINKSNLYYNYNTKIYSDLVAFKYPTSND